MIGGLAAERLAAWGGVESLLVLLAALHLFAFLALRGAIAVQEPTRESSVISAWESARDAFRRAPFLTNLSLLVLAGTVSATLLDFIFKSSAAAMYGKGPQLTRYFALFHTGSQCLSFLAQSFVAPAALRRLGLGRTMQAQAPHYSLHRW